jgi:hypothetical protein
MRVTDMVLQALRTAVQPDLDDFRAATTAQRCARCDAVDDLTTDHVFPSFDAIATDFLSHLRPVQLQAVSGGSEILADPALEAEWIVFHARRAVYQLLCRRCNSEKGSR